jgi:hypothetical protein
MLILFEGKDTPELRNIRYWKEPSLFEGKARGSPALAWPSVVQDEPILRGVP